MASKVRMKVRCTGKSDASYGVTPSITLQAVYSPDPNHENRKWWQATPAGSIQFYTVNEQAAAAFEEGKEYFVDFTPAEDS